MKIKSVIVTVLLICSVALVALGYFIDRQSAPTPGKVHSDRVPHIEMAGTDDEFSLVGPAIVEWTKWEFSAEELNSSYRALAAPYVSRNITLNWAIFDIPDGSFIQKQHFEISEDQSYQNARRYDLRAGERSITLTNLRVDTQYFVRVIAELESASDITAEASFVTAWSPRIIECPGITNVRDIGGWKTVDGKTVKQGLVYRGSELDGISNGNFLISDSGVDVMRDELKIKTELDLRSVDFEKTKDKLGQNVGRELITFPSYWEFYLEYSKDQVKKTFEVLADRDNYPVYLHCTDGADRTGVLCYVLESLLGMSAEDCYREWELSVFALGNGNYEAMDRFVTNFQLLEGETQQEKAENYLLSIGLTQEKIDNITDILLK